MATLLCKIINTGGVDVEEAEAGKHTYIGIDHDCHWHVDPATGLIEEFDSHKSGGSQFVYIASATLVIKIGYLGRNGVFDELLSSV
jgi:hypothetical protein